MTDPDWDNDRTVSGASFVPDKDKAAPEISLDQTAAAVSMQPPKCSFAPNDVAAGRFRILRFLARGGMGEVYEAEDLELRERVALKTVRLEMARDERAVERFRREIQLARKVTHPNVCRTFDVFRHVETSKNGPTTETLAISMEFLAGETLEQRIRRTGRMSTAEALPIIVQMTAGLRAAHQVGVVHRDFKSSNIILVAAEDYPGHVRAVITDFGLARSDAALSGQSLTNSSDIVGTPAYMAPEQLQGGEITPATDIYALGVVMFQMVTGTLPFVGDTALATAFKRLSEPAPSPRSIVRELDPKWDLGILRCLEREPANRFGGVQDIVPNLTGELAPVSPRLSVIWRRRRYSILALACILLIAAGMGYFGLRYRFELLSRSRPSVAVLGFRNISGKDEFNRLGPQLAEQLRPQLETGQIRLVDPAIVDRMTHDFGWEEGLEYLSDSDLKKVRAYLDCDIVVVGSYDVVGTDTQQEIAWNIRLEKTKDGETIGTVPERMAASDRLNRTPIVGQQVRDRLGVKVPTYEASLLNAADPANGDALSYLSEGREQMAKFDVLAASKSFEEAVRADDNYAEAHSALANALSALGYDATAEREAKRALDLSNGLSSEVRNLIQARYYEISQNWDQAIKYYSSLWTLNHDTPEYALMLARSQESASKPQEALQTLTDLDKSKLPAGIAAQADLAEATVQQDLANYPDQLKSAKKAIQEAKQLSAGVLLARASIQECLADLNIDGPAAAKRLCDNALKLNRDTGDQLGVAKASNAIANALSAKGSLKEAVPLYQSALQVSRSIGDKLDQAGALNNLANIISNQGDLDAAKELYRESIQVARDRDDKNDLALAQQNLAGVLYIQGDRKDADELFGEAIDLARKIDAKDVEALVLNNRCMFETNAGELNHALQDCRESLGLRTEARDTNKVATSLQNIGRVYFYRGDLEQAKQNYQQALSIEHGLDAEDDEAYSKLLLAEVSVVENQAAAAHAGTEEVVKVFVNNGDKSGESEARTTLAEALLDLGQSADARVQIIQALKLAEGLGDRGLTLEAEIASTRIDAGTDSAASAVRALEKIQKQAGAAGLVAVEFEARLALGESEIKSGRAAEGRAILRDLSQAAAARGFGYIAATAKKEI
jgi:serine/threonine protein kinase/tetratricopeptide (TPR) repeat protein